jgi:hypothetical protein
MYVNPINVLLGLTMSSVTGSEGDDEMIFTATTGQKFKFYHCQNCCESVSINDVIGDLTDLVGSPILLAEEVSSEAENNTKDDDYSDSSFTWTFYRFATIKGTVTVRWYGSSNGYYSEEVSFDEIS